jgi:hypothetical protein
MERAMISLTRREFDAVSAALIKAWSEAKPARRAAPRLRLAAGARDQDSPPRGARVAARRH